MLLLRRLDHLRHEVFEAFVVSNNDEGIPEKVVPPFANCRGNSMEFPYVSRGMLQSWTEYLAEEGNGMRVLLKHCSHGRTRSIGFEDEGQCEIRIGA